MSEGEPAVRVLIVDDHHAFRRAARKVVEVLPGFEVAAEAATGEASVDTAGAVRPDLVLMDVHLPGIDGIEATRRILGNARERAPVIFLLSTDEAGEYTQQVTDCGATAYLQKVQFGPAALRVAWANATASRGRSEECEGAYAWTAMPIRVVLAEDNLLVREGVRRLLEMRKGSGIEVVGTCGDLPSLLEAVEAELPDVVLTDIRMPPTHTDEGLQAAAQLRKAHPHVGVVLLSQFDAPVYARALLEEGSAGRAYLLKERVSDPEQLEAAIREVARGGSVIDPKVVEALVAALGNLVPEGEVPPSIQAPPRTGHAQSEALTERELQVLQLIAQGDSNQEIAQRLVVSLATVKTHVNHVFAKLNAESRVQVVARARALGLLAT